VQGSEGGAGKEIVRALPGLQVLRDIEGGVEVVGEQVDLDRIDEAAVGEQDDREGLTDRVTEEGGGVAAGEGGGV
jgi:hypothetical protein